MPLNPNGYPLDITGVSATNLITAEIHTFTTTDSRTFVPDGGPFFTQGLQLRHGVTNILLQPMVDYIVLHLHKAATREAYKEVCAVIRMLNSNIPSISMQYQCIGGLYSETVTAIRDLVAQNPIVSNRLVGWGEIIGIPYQFPPSEHLHHADEVYGLQEVVSVLEQVRLAIMAGDSGAFNAVYQYIFTLFENVDYVCQEQLDDVIDLIPYIPIKVVRNLLELRALNTMANFTASIYVTCGALNMLDGKGRLWIWDITSTAVDNDIDVIMPTVVQGGPGRFIRFLSSDNQLIDIERRLQEAGIAVDLAETNYTEVDFNLLTRTRQWYTGDTNPNKPFVRTVLEVTSLSDTDCLQVAYNKANRATRYGYDGVAHADHTWTEWVFSEQAELAVTSNYGRTLASLDDNLRNGRHWFDERNAMRPFEQGWMEVVNIGGTGNGTHQIAYATDGNVIATRRRYDNVWSMWTYYLDTGTAKRFGIDVDLAGQLNAVGTGYDLNNYGRGGKYWISEGVLNVPLDRVTGQPLAYAVFEIDQLNSTDCIQTVYKLGQISRRYGYSGTNYSGHTWGDWLTEVTHTDIDNAVGAVGTVTGDIGLRLQEAGIAVDLAVTNYTGDDFNILTRTRKWYTGDTNPNRPFIYTVLDVISLSDTDCLQTSHNSGNRATRYGFSGVDHAGHTWTPWIYSEQAGVAITSNYGDTSASLDDNLKVGRHWFDNRNASRPFESGWVEVVNIGGGGNATHQIAYAENGMGIATRRRTANVWSEWMYSLDTVTAKRFGIDVDLAGSLNGIGSGYSLNNYGRGGKYWIHNGVLDAPMDSITGLPVEYAVFYIDQLNSNDCIQTVYKLGQISRRYGSAGTNYAGHTWSGWVTEVTHKDLNDLNGQIYELGADLGIATAVCNAGITVRNTGTTSNLLLAHIGEQASPFVRVFINGQFVIVDIRNVPALRAADDQVHSNNSLLYVYLEMDGSGGYQLHCYYTPPVWGPFSKTARRAPLTFDGPSGTTSPVVFLGMAWLINGRWGVVRSWFQDPGFLDHYPLFEYARNDILDRTPFSGAIGRMDIDDDIYTESGFSNSLFYGAFWDSYMQPIDIIAWGGEQVDITLTAQAVVANATGGDWRGHVDLNVDNMLTYVQAFSARGSIVSHNPGIDLNVVPWQQLCISDAFVAPAVGVYRVALFGGVEDAGSRLFLRGRHALTRSHSVMTAKLKEMHSYEQLVISAYPPAGINMTVILDINGLWYNVDMYQEFVNQIGQQPLNVPLLTLVTWEVQSGAFVGSSTTDTASMFLNSNWPPSIRPRIVNHSNIMGRGGRGGSSGPMNTGRIVGEKGGDAIYSVRALTLENYGLVGGGGGGGGQGSSASSGGTGSFGGAGGGGGGLFAGVSETPYYDNGSYTGRGYAGQSGSGTQGGIGGISETGGPHNENFSQGGAGGRGGDLGQPGANGLDRVASDYGNNAQAGGAAGRAVVCGGDGLYIPPGAAGDIRGALVRI